MVAELDVIASKHHAISSRLDSWPTCKPIKATSSISALPSEYQGSITQSEPNPIKTPESRNSLTLVCPLRFGYVSCRP